jgi:Holliday junction resolvasome RuvABC ATP-dependent DNA helicase subunit
MFKGYIGQTKITRELQAIAHSVKQKRKDSVNIILRGPAGSGKTMLAEEFCKFVGGRYSYQIADNNFDLKGYGTIRCHVVDEIHMMKNFEQLYEFMDSGKYIIVFCTTDFGDLPDPFSSRCITFNMREYTDEELAKIAVNYARELGLAMNLATAFLIAVRSRGNPRKVKVYTRRIKFLLDNGLYPLTINGVEKAFKDIGVYSQGYTDIDRDYLKFIAKVPSASLKNISRTIGVDENTIKNDIEPFLIEKGHITISSRGRKFLDWKGLE